MFLSLGFLSRESKPPCLATLELHTRAMEALSFTSWLVPGRD